MIGVGILPLSNQGDAPCLARSLLTFLFLPWSFASLGSAGVARAGGVCGGTYIADSGDTVEKIASKCGTTASAIYAANP